MHLNLFQVSRCGQIPGAWRHPVSDPPAVLQFEELVRVARLAEDACFDSLFWADQGILFPTWPYDDAGWRFDPMTVISTLAPRTSRIGLIATASTSFAQPYDLARKFASLDHLSGGRVGWNIVTGLNDAEARNFGADALLDPVLRYEKAAEFLEVTMALWRSWDHDAFVMDKDSGVYVHPDKVRPIDHEGRHYRVAGPLNVPPMPQGYPVIVQAGQSETGRDFAARFAEVVFAAKSAFEEAREYTQDLRARAERHGRGPGSIVVLPGLYPILGDSEAEARELEHELRSLIHPAAGYRLVLFMTGLDLSEYDPEGPVPVDAIDEAALKSGAGSRAYSITDWARRTNASMRDLMWSACTRGHVVMTGTPDQLADWLQQWFDGGACDGFNVIPPLVPKSVEDFVEGVVPRLQHRGLFRTRYTGTTLREHCGLEQPRAVPRLAAV
jgi:FMN-dependent oxidoreductase (nitrilotriacetate monooxygenase family)